MKIILLINFFLTSAYLFAQTKLEVRKKIIDTLVIDTIKYKNVEEIEVNETTLRHIPPTIGKLSKLNRLYVYSSFLTELPEEIGDCTNLELIDLGNGECPGNRLTTLPMTLSKLKRLKSLWVGDNRFREIPEVIYSLDSLRSLGVNQNNIYVLDKKISQLRNLHTLYIGDNNISELPNELSNLIQLETLWIGGNPIKKLPNNLSKLKNLRSLYIYDMNLKKIPKFVYKLKNLEELNLALNDIKESEIKQLQKKLPKCEIFYK